MTQQYVGPYFVPHGWTQWSNNVQYDPLYVVSYNLAWYILAQPAPVGTEPTQDGGVYWKQVDNWQGNVENLTKTVEELLNKVESPDLSKRNIIIIGDSYTTGHLSSSIGGGSNTPYYLLPPFTEAKLIYGSNLWVAAQDGAGIENLNNIPTFLDLVKNISIGVENNEITDILIVGGYNDYGQLTQTNFNALISYLKTTYINAKIHLAYLAVNVSNPHNNTTWYNSSGKIWRACANQGAVYIDDSEFILNSPTVMASDNMHPNQNGQLRISESLISGICYGKAKNYMEYVPQINLNNSLYTVTSYLDAFIDRNDITIRGSFFIPESLTLEALETTGFLRIPYTDIILEPLSFKTSCLITTSTGINFMNISCAEETSNNSYLLSVNVSQKIEGSTNTRFGYISIECHMRE